VSSQEGANVSLGPLFVFGIFGQQANYKRRWELQKTLSAGDWVLTKSWIPGTKDALQSYFGYGGHARLPSKRVCKAEAQRIKAGIKELMQVEANLPDTFPKQ
jgi:L-threo-3-deoxy-hexylosonate aldolase